MSSNDCRFMQEAIDFAKLRNTIWPFAALIIDESGRIICKATDCAHISPLFHAESLAIHVLITATQRTHLGELSLYTTAEPDVLSQSAIHWANIVHDLNIKQVYYGSTLATVQSHWSFGINISAQEIIQRSTGPKVELIGPLLESSCDNLFQNAKQQQLKINNRHPAQGLLSQNINDFYELYL